MAIKKGKIISLIKQFDLDIRDVHTQEDPFNEEMLYAGDDWTEENKQGFQASLAVSEHRVITGHQVYDAQRKPVALEAFDLQRQESEGTQKLFAMAGFLVNALEAGFTLLMDEVDVKLHPLITQAVISLFNSKASNLKGSQLILTTHDANLLDSRLLRRDQIWFMDKDRYGASHLVSLAEYRVEKEATFEKDYLEGRYGGVPALGNPNGVFENAHA